MGKVPKFKNEAEEAKWWSSKAGQAHTTKTFEKAIQAGTIRRGTPPEVAKALKRAKIGSVPIHIRIPAGDLEAAKLVAKRKGLGYQTYLKMLMHEGVQKDIKPTTTETRNKRQPGVVV